MNWRDTPDGRHCDRHDRPLKRGEVCTACITDPPPLGDEVTSDEVDRELLATAQDFQTRERKLWNECKRLLDDGTAQDLNAAAKLSAESAKWSRLVLEVKGQVSQRKQLREAIAHEKAMQGKRGAH